MSRQNRIAAWKAIESDGKLGAGPKLLLLRIGDLVADGRMLTASQRRLAADLGVSRSTVQRWLHGLVVAGYLIPVEAGRGRRTNTCLLNFVVDAPASTNSTSVVAHSEAVVAHLEAVVDARGGHKPKEPEKNRAGGSSSDAFSMSSSSPIPAVEETGFSLETPCPECGSRVWFRRDHIDDRGFAIFGCGRCDYRERQLADSGRFLEYLRSEMEEE